MSKGAKQNWLESPNPKNGFWFFHQEKNEIFNFYQSNTNQKTLFLTPFRNSKPIEIQKNRNTPNNYLNQINQKDNCKFGDLHQADLFTSNKNQKHVINQKINFQDSSVIKQQQDFMTPLRQAAQSESSCIRQKNYLHDTTAKKSNFNLFQRKKTRPKEKGLRMLSQKAYQIVLKMNGATYKQVANVLVDQLAIQDSVQIDDKDKQNIKRRVYDALNVLIALGVLRKDGRKIHGVQRKRVQRNQKYRNEDQIRQQRKKLDELNNQIKQKQMVLDYKRSKYKKLQQKYAKIKALIKRNQLSSNRHNIIQFPFVATTILPRDQDKIFVNRNRVQINSSLNVPQTFGDIDAISYLKQSLKDYIQ